MKTKIIGFFLTILISGLIMFTNIDNCSSNNPNEAYQVYLEGNKIGLISSKDEFLDLIDKEQSQIKEKYGVKKVYPPKGLDIEKIYTYNNELSDIEKVYDQIKDIEPFSIEGYKVTITYTEKKVINDGEILEPAKPLVLYTLHKNDIEESLYNTAAAFIGTEDLVNYQESTQKDIDDTGYKLTSVYFEETITVKKDYISTEEYIFKDSDTLSRYLLFGTLDKQKSYTTKDGENLEAIAEANNLNIEELLIANPQYANANVLLSAGENINVGLVAPLVSVVYKKNVISDVSIDYKTEYKDDKTKYTDYKKVTTEGQKGITRVTQDIKYINGEIRNLKITKKEPIKPVVNKVITRGTKIIQGYNYEYENVSGNDEWSWPTLTPYVITSRFEWRWGKMHRGIDISGCGYGSPIYAVADGYVFKINTNPHMSEGLSVYIDHGNGYVTQYMHLSKILAHVGDEVEREDKIGLMGSTGFSTGTHLHLGVWKGIPYQGGTALNPCKSIFSC